MNRRGEWQLTGTLASLCFVFCAKTALLNHQDDAKDTTQDDFYVIIMYLLCHYMKHTWKWLNRNTKYRAPAASWAHCNTFVFPPLISPPSSRKAARLEYRTIHTCNTNKKKKTCSKARKKREFIIIIATTEQERKKKRAYNNKIFCAITAVSETEPRNENEMCNLIYNHATTTTNAPIKVHDTQKEAKRKPKKNVLYTCCVAGCYHRRFP